MKRDPRCSIPFLVQQMQYFNAIMGYKAFKLQTNILQRSKSLKMYGRLRDLVLRYRNLKKALPEI